MKKQGVYLQAIVADAKEAVIDVVGIIGWDVWFPAMREMLRSIPETIERVVFDIYSPGGSVWDGNGIVQEIGKMKQHTVARVQVAASMATLIAVACKERSIAGNGRFLVHNAWTVTEGDAEAHEKTAKELRDCEAEAIKFYAARTGKSEDSIRELMKQERWMTPEEAKEWGFVTEIDNPFDVAAFATVRDEIRAEGKWPMALADVDEPKQEEKKNDDATAGGAEGATDGADVQASKPDVFGAADVEAARAEGITLGKAQIDEGIQARAIAAEAKVLELTAAKADLQSRLDASVLEARKFQGERDQARASNDKVKASFDEANAKIERLLSGGMKFTPSVETWEQAMRACNGNYEMARKQFPDVYRAQREQDKASRNQKEG